MSSKNIPADKVSNFFSFFAFISSLIDEILPKKLTHNFNFNFSTKRKLIEIQVEKKKYSNSDRQKKNIFLLWALYKLTTMMIIFVAATKY
jgi:hypothetical protein